MGNYDAVSVLRIIIIVLVALVPAIINSLIMKQQDNENLGGDSTFPFVHPWFQMCQVFFGQTLVLLLFNFLMKFSDDFKNEVREKKQDSASKTPLPIGAPFVPAILDLCSLCLTFNAIYAMLPSILVMLKTTTPLLNSIFAAIFLNKPLSKSQKIGFGIVFVGAVCACVETIALTHIEDYTDAVLGLVFVLCSMVFSGFQHVTEHKITKRYYYHPFEYAGYEGIWGLVVGIIVFFVVDFIPCSLKSPFCSGGHWENVESIGLFMRENGGLVALVIVAVITPTVGSLIGIPMGKYVPSPVKTLMDVFVVMFAWFYTLFYLDERFIVTHLIGFILFAIGMLVYNRVLAIPGIVEKERKKMMDSENLNASQSRLLNQSADV